MQSAPRVGAARAPAIACEAVGVGDRRARPARPRGRTRRRRGRARTSRRRRPSRPEFARSRAAGSRARRGSAIEPSLRERDDRVRALEPAHRVRDGLVERRLVVRDQRRDQLAVGRRAERDAGLAQLLAQLADVDRGCRCGRARRCARGRAGRAAARSPTATSRSSSSACGRSRPGRAGRASFCSSKTCETRPRSRSAVRRPCSETAMPADSWPRCCSAKRPKYVSRATSRSGA